MLLEETRQLVEQAITTLGLNPDDCRGENAGQWNLKKGQFDILVDTWEEQGQALFQVMCPLCTPPEENKEGFFAFLLERNHGMSQIAYTHHDGNIFLKSTREARGLTQDEIITLLSKTAFYAEQSDFVPAD